MVGSAFAVSLGFIFVFSCVHSMQQEVHELRAFAQESQHQRQLQSERQFTELFLSEIYTDADASVTCANAGDNPFFAVTIDAISEQGWAKYRYNAKKEDDCQNAVGQFEYCTEDGKKSGHACLYTKKPTFN